jgi:hypothetical protein
MPFPVYVINATIDNTYNCVINIPLSCMIVVAVLVITMLLVQAGIMHFLQMFLCLFGRIITNIL